MNEITRREFLACVGCVAVVSAMPADKEKATETPGEKRYPALSWEQFSFFDVHRHRALTLILQSYAPEKLASAYVRMYYDAISDQKFLEVRARIGSPIYRSYTPVVDGADLEQHVAIIGRLLLDLQKALKAKGIAL